jgi:hypothetical protein
MSQREIKFRAWDGEKILLDVVPTTVPHEDPMIIETHWGAGCRLRSVKAIMQYTGFKDRHGKEIFEGDILEEGQATPIRGIVIWNQETGCFCYKTDLSTIGLYYLFAGKIIGNIYENPDALPVKLVLDSPE